MCERFQNRCNYFVYFFFKDALWLHGDQCRLAETLTEHGVGESGNSTLYTAELALWSALH